MTTSANEMRQILKDQTIALEASLQHHLAHLQQYGADEKQIEFAKMMLLTARMHAVNAIYSGSINPEYLAKTEEELL